MVDIKCNNKLRSCINVLYLFKFFISKLYFLKYVSVSIRLKVVDLKVLYNVV